MRWIRRFHCLVAREPGTYTVTIEEAAFERSVLNSLHVSPGASARAGARGTRQSVTFLTGTPGESELLEHTTRGESASKPALVRSSNPGRCPAFQSNGCFGSTNAIRIGGASTNNVSLPHVAARESEWHIY